jgi:FAD/FMN-containing dehydrogenase
LHGAVVPRTKLVDVLRRVPIGRAAVAMMNVFHAGDGNLHPLIVFGARSCVWGRAIAGGRSRRVHRRWWRALG